ncbi:MAG: polyphosphate kinase 1 [Candidatus Obscuribacter phosphatis]|uniref:Polyphosphate kinase n=1 Tax=Candidatus Obscuribacter phosphatis TaxID=1906157 RepID=A0A8J7P9T6_9BACT|nr:polyphosphate kinase 1 [Candidatus Obscuribacter phosphatis]
MQPDPSNSRKTTEIKRSEALDALVSSHHETNGDNQKSEPAEGQSRMQNRQAQPGDFAAIAESGQASDKINTTAAPPGALPEPAIERLAEALNAAVNAGISTMPQNTLPPSSVYSSLIPANQLTEPPHLAVTAPSEPIVLSDSRYYINRELSLLAFQWRVLEEAMDASNPLLERFRYLSIVGSNLDEFFMVRVAGLKRQIESGVFTTGLDGLTPSEQLDAVSSEVTRLLATAHDCLTGNLIPELKNKGINLTSFEELPEEEKELARDYFEKKIFPVLTPLAFDPGHPFPHISNLSLNLAVLIRDHRGEERFARLKIPDSLPQLVPVVKQEPPSQRSSRIQCCPNTFVWLDDLIRANLGSLFPGMTVLESYPFHVTRDAEVEIQEWEAGDLLETTEEGVKQRRFGDVVRLSVHHAMPAHILEILMSNLQIEPYDVYLVEGRISLSSLKFVSGIDRHDLKFPSFVPAIPQPLDPELLENEEDFFAAVSRRDIVLHHPYDSFQPVVNFLNTAARDPNVLAIKATLYRVGKNSPVVEALLKAQENGKQVAVLVELKARFDEESNIEWAKALESQGVHVVYGLLGLKIHSKVALVVRKEGDTIKRYVHLGTGNYNAVTAHLYTDVGLLTADENVASDVSDLFNYLTGYSAKRDYKRLLVAPINLRDRFEYLIKREIEQTRKGEKGRIILKMNALVDERIIQLLYEASQAGVKVDLMVRGICCLRPGIPGVSENIRVISVVGRFLEHSRIYYFRNGGQEEIYCGSADMMPRNLNRRVEVVFPVLDERLARYLKDAVLKTYLVDTAKAREMKADGSYVRLSAHAGEPFSCQQWFLANAASGKVRY